ncbi:MAG: ATP-binding protein, partial [Candidatus Binatia bacterium]
FYSANVDATTMRLQPLTAEESDALLEALSGSLGSAFPPALRELVTRCAGGNPFFLEEVIHSLSDTGVLIKDPQGVHCSVGSGNVTNLEIPSTIQGIIHSRLDSLESGAKQLLLEAAVIGPSFDLELLQQITTRPRELQSLVETLLRADLLTESSWTGGRSSEYRFRNALIQEVAYNSLLKKRRAALHGTIARTLERLHLAQLDDYLSQLAHHYSLSDDQEQAFHYLLRAGDKAARVYANQDAISYYRRALDIVEQQRDHLALKAEVLEKLADAHNASGEPEAARESWEAALLLYETLQQKQRVAAIHRKIGLHWWGQGDRAQATAHLQRGLQLLTTTPECVEAALLYQELGRLSFRIGDDEQAIE